MKTLRIILITVGSTVFLIVAVLFVIGNFRPKPAGIKVESNPSASVYINGILVGKTPYSGTHDAGEIDLKLVPNVTDANLFPFETRVTLASGIETVVGREFGTSEDASSGAIISFERASANETSMVVVSTPDNAQVSVDGVSRGFAPYKTSTISPAEHQITIRAPGYVDRVMTVTTIQGFNLTLFVKLAKSKNVSATASPSPTPASQIFVLILDTPTGYLRVRTEPQSQGSEIAQVKPGEKYLYLGVDQASGWYKIQYEAPKPGLPGGIVGWVSNQYSKLLDTSGAQVASPSATPIVSQ